MMTQMLRRRRSEEGKKIRSQMMREGKGDHCSFKYKQMELEDCPYSSTITTLCTKDNQIIEIYRL